MPKYSGADSSSKMTLTSSKIRLNTLHDFRARRNNCLRLTRQGIPYLFRFKGGENRINIMYYCKRRTASPSPLVGSRLVCLFEKFLEGLHEVSSMRTFRIQRGTCWAVVKEDNRPNTSPFWELEDWGTYISSMPLTFPHPSISSIS